MAKGAGGVRESKPRLTKDQLLDLLSVRQQEYEIDGLGTVLVQGVAVNRYEQIQAVDDDPNSMDSVKRICLIGLIEPELTAEDLDALAEKDAGRLAALSNVILDLSGLRKDSKPIDFLVSTKT